MEHVAFVSGSVAALLSGSFSATQVVRVARSGSTAGLSDVSWLLLALTFGTWLSWGLLTRDLFQVVPNVTSFAGAVWVLWRVHRDRPIPARRVVAAAAAVAVAFVLQRAGGTGGALIAVFAVTSVIRARQAGAVRTATDITAVSLVPWAVSSAAQVCWLVHGVTAGRVVVAAHAPFAIVANMLLVAAVLSRRRELALD